MDLHIHTCLSPCGSSSAVPTRIVAAAVRKRLNAIAICDHNASENVAAVKKAAEGTDLFVFGGMEITTRSEIHVLTIFDNDVPLFEMQKIVYDHLTGENNPDFFGPQYIVDHEDYIEGTNGHLLMGAADLEIEKIVTIAHDLGAVVIASHVDREAFGIISQLGIIPDNLALDALELSKQYRTSPFSLRDLGFPFITSSDAHSPEEIGTAATDFFIEYPSAGEIRDALAGKNNRKTFSPLVA